MTAAHTRGFALFARAGYAARGLVYTLIGAFTVYAAWRGGGDSPGSKEAVKTILEAPAGDVLALGLLAGLAGYAAWRFVQAVFDTDDHGFDPRGLAVRAGLLASCASYGLLVAWTFSRWRGSGGSGGGGLAETLAGFIGHRVTAVVLALVFAGVAFAHLRKAWVKGYEKHFDADQAAMKWIHPVSRVGLVARGMVFVILALLLGWRAWTARGAGGETPGLEQALTALRGLPAGTWLLGAMGAGLLCFAGYSFVEARYRRINVEDA